MAFPEWIGLFTVGAIIIGFLTLLAVLLNGSSDRDYALMQLMAENPVAGERWIQRWGRPAGETVRWWQWGPKARRWRRSARLRLPEKKKEQASQWGQGNGNNTVMQPTRGPAARAFVLPLTFAGRVRTSNPEGWEDVDLTLTGEVRRRDEPSLPPVTVQPTTGSLHHESPPTV
jgi:hypothetical protein